MFNACAHKKSGGDQTQFNGPPPPNYFVADGWIAKNKKTFVSK
jgi:hypothetical protein